MNPKNQILVQTLRGYLCIIRLIEFALVIFSLPGVAEVGGGGGVEAGGSAVAEEVTGMPPATAAARMMALPLLMRKYRLNGHILKGEI